MGIVIERLDSPITKKTVVDYLTKLAATTNELEQGDIVPEYMAGDIHRAIILLQMAKDEQN